MPRTTQALLKDLGSRDPERKYAASKALRNTSEQSPERLLPQLDQFAGMLSHENSFLRWDAMRIAGNLAAISDDATAERIVAQLAAVISGPQMVGAATAIASATSIALQKPHLADRIAREILNVRTAQYRTEECRNIAIGHAITALERLSGLLRDLTPALTFVREQLDNPRKATRNKAAKFLKRHPAAMGAAR